MFFDNEPPGLSDADREAVASPLADYELRTVARWQAEALRSRVPSFTLARRLVAALISGGWPTAQAVLDEAEARGLTKEVLEACAADAAVLTLRSSGGDVDTASNYFEQMLRHQQLLDEGVE
ncbi:hypothetical protein ACJH6J_27200 [Mycobacterium sp. SMC-18]|uniref:hypothetical protein n=1 Tax=Mycobacteriaceae TaxID=1762 RepID=UPI001BB45A7C|nr:MULTISPECIES: hypothetical protein [unclassified Mycolicibacterium]BCI83582.1 hypothetical protein MTY66_52070 [Mycolicibacterium sp. TY66]BCJ78776.1 hypothetical protein MTY81_01490 [Mycolicibacterium sp. TY81]